MNAQLSDTMIWYQLLAFSFTFHSAHSSKTKSSARATPSIVANSTKQTAAYDLDGSPVWFPITSCPEPMWSDSVSCFYPWQISATFFMDSVIIQDHLHQFKGNATNNTAFVREFRDKHGLTDFKVWVTLDPGFLPRVAVQRIPATGPNPALQLPPLQSTAFVWEKGGYWLDYSTFAINASPNPHVVSSSTDGCTDGEVDLPTTSQYYVRCQGCKHADQSMESTFSTEDICA